MTRYGRRALLAAAVALGALGASGAMLIGRAGASPSSATVTLSGTGPGSVKVAWHFSSTTSRNGLALEIDRGPSPSALTALLDVRRPRSDGYRLDRRPLDGVAYYRVRLFDHGALDGSSAIVEYGVNSGGSSTTQAPSTSAASTTVPSTTTTTPVNHGGACATARIDILKLVNQARTDNAVTPLLTGDGRLDTAAQTHSDWMASTGSFSHDGWTDEISATGYPPGYWGQNIAAGQATADSVMKAWMSSAGHKANILSPNYRHLGVGCTMVNEGYGTYWTQDFGS